MDNKVRLVCFKRNDYRALFKIVLLSNFSLRVVLCLAGLVFYYVVFDYDAYWFQRIIRFLEVFLTITPVSLLALLIVNFVFFKINQGKEVCLSDLSRIFKRKKMSAVLRASKNILLIRLGRFKSVLFYYEDDKKLDEVQQIFIDFVNSKE